jgi:hypothetical protein
MRIRALISFRIRNEDFCSRSRKNREPMPNLPRHGTEQAPKGNCKGDQAIVLIDADIGKKAISGWKLIKGDC